MKLAFVVQRYGADIAGGSEGHCRELTRRLAPIHDITVLTTCARDYVTWENALPAGNTREDGAQVIRFPVRQPRRRAEFAALTDEVLDGAPPDREEEWFRANGPDVPDLLDHLRQHGTAYDLVLFWTFRYYPSFFGVPIVADRAVLIPTAEEDRIVTLGTLESFFRMPAGYLFMTPEEEALVTARAGTPLQPKATVGVGIDPVGPVSNAADLLAAREIRSPFLLYLGRVDRNKGCETLLEYFQDYAAERSDLSLVLAGPATMQIPVHPRIRALGYVSHEMREALVSQALALVVPSPYESLSIVLLEAWNRGVPAVVNAFCKVLRGQVQRANGGLYYQSSREFIEAVSYLSTHPGERTALGTAGLAYVEREYRWPVVISKVGALLDAVRSRSQTV